MLSHQRELNKMTLMLSLLLLVAALLVPGESSDLRSTSVEQELHVLRTIFDQALTNYDVVYASLVTNCPDACPNGQCVDGCLFKLLQQYEERLRALQTVILKLEKLACKECPGTFLTTMPVAAIHGLAASSSSSTSGSSAELRVVAPINVLSQSFKQRAPLNSNPLSQPSNPRAPLSDDTLRQPSNVKPSVDHHIFDSYESILVSSMGKMYRETPSETFVLKGWSRSVTYDPFTSRVYTVEQNGTDGSVSIFARNRDKGFVVGSLGSKYNHGNKQPVDIAMYGSSQIAVITTDGSSSELELIDTATNTKTSLADIKGLAKRITTDHVNGKIFYTSNTGVFEYNVKGDHTKMISSTKGATGIDYYARDHKLFYCEGKSGTIGSYNTKTGSAKDEEKDYSGCSDMRVKGLWKPGQSPIAVPTIHYVVVSWTDHKVIDFMEGKPDGVDRMTEKFYSLESASITFIPKTNVINLG